MKRLHRADSRAISGCLSSSSIPLFLSEASLPPLRVTLTHFTLSSYEWALRLPTSFSISSFAKIGVKPRFCRSFGRAFASTYQLMLSPYSPREAFLAFLPFLLEICLPSLWSPFFPLHALDRISLSPAKVRLSLTLTLSHLTVWCSGQTSVFLFLLAKAALAYLSTALFVALKSLSPFWNAQYDYVFPLKPAPFCKLFARLGSTSKSITSLLFSSYLTLACPRHFVFSSVFPFTSISLAYLAGTVFSLFLFYQTTVGPWTFVSPEE